MAITTNEPPDKWTPDYPECTEKDHAWVRCNTGKKSHPGYFDLGGGDYKLYEECTDCGACRLIVVRGGRAEYTYRQGKERQGKERQGKERQGKERQGKERQGKERQGKERQGKERQGKERQGKERQGKERQGKERQGKDRLQHARA